MLLDQLQGFSRDTKIDFSCLDFHRVKSRGDKLIQIEFNQLVYRDPQGDVVVDNLE